MKKITLFLMTMVLSMVSALSAFAQEPAAPKFSPVATDGQTVQYLYNVETHAFVLGANDWGTRASVSVEKGNQFKVTVNNGAYKLSDLVGSNWNAIDCDGNADSWVDGQGRSGDGTWGIKDLGNNTYELTNTVGSAAGKVWCVVRDLSNTRVVFKAPGAAYGATWAFVNAEDYDEYIANLDKDAVNAYIAEQAAVVKEALKDEIRAAQKVSLDAMKSLIEGTNVYGEGFDAYAEKYADLLAQYENGTLEETPVNPNATTGWHSSTAYNFLLTPWISNGKACNNFDNNLYINTWSNEGLGDGSNFLVPFFEYWTGDDASLAANTIKTTITGLEPGKTYQATAWTRVRIKNGASDPTGITFQVGNGDAVNVCAGDKFGAQFYIINAQAEGVADEEGNLEIAYVVAADNNISWLSFKDVFYSEVAANVEVTPAFIVEGEENPYTLNDHSAVSVPAANSLRVNFGDNAAKIKHATYVINELVEDEFMGVVDIIEQEVTSGTLSMNTFGYAEFDEPLTFYYGHKYNILIKAWDVTSDNLFDENFVMATPIATFTCEFNGSTDTTPAINMGQYQLAETMRNGMEINAEDWEGFTISYPENNVNAALAGNEALEYGAIATIVVKAQLLKEGAAEPVAEEQFASDFEINSVSIFTNVELEPGAAYTIVIPAGGVTLQNQMDYENPVLWSSEEEIKFQFTTAAVADEPVIAYTDLTADMFKEWDSYEANANVVGPGAGEYHVGESTGLPFGNGSVLGAHYADLSEYDVLQLTVTEGAPRMLFNRPAMGDSGVADYLEIKSADNEYVTVEGNVWTVDIAAIVAKYGYCHLNAIKGANWANTTITSMQLGKVEENLELAILPSLVLGEEEVAINDHSEVSVEMADGIKVAFENGAAVRGVSYAINIMKATESEEGTTWNPDESYDLAVGELSLNNVAFGQFEEPIYFEQGNKYQIKVTAYVANGTEEYDEVVKYYIINGAYAPELAILPSLVLGEEEVAINDHSEVSVDVINGLKVEFENGASVLGVSYAINAMKATESEEGTTWNPDESYDIAVGEMSMNTVAFVEFEDAISFEQGNKYQIKITTYVNNGTDTPDEIVKYYIINGALAPEIAVTPSLIDGDNEVALNSHSAVSVEAANAIKVQIDNAPEAIGVTYLINEMNQNEDEEGTFWTVGKELAAGEASMNTIAYAELETPLTFAFGKKYQLSVSVFGQPADEPQELGTYTYEFNGATEVELASGDYVIKNVESGLYLNGANSWGTKASATKHGQFMTATKVADGTYTIDSHISNGGDKHYLAAGDNTFLDALPANHTIEMVAPGIFTIKDANDMYLAQGEDGLVNFNAAEVTDAAKWQFITKEQLLVSLEDATAAEPGDATALIGDAGFGRNNQYISMWQGAPAKGGDNTNMCGEKYNCAFNVFQTLENMPNGLYTLKVQGFYRNGSSANAAATEGAYEPVAFFYANADSVEVPSIFMDAAKIEGIPEDLNGYMDTDLGAIPNNMTRASQAFSQGLYGTEINFEVSDNTITLGVCKDAANEPDMNWTIFDNFELYYLGTGAVDPVEIEPALIAGEEEITLNSHSNVSVESATAIKVNVMNCPQAIGVTYLINEMNQNEDEEGTFWTVGKEIAAGEASMNTIAYAEFDNELVFEYGKKYQLTVTVMGQPASEPQEVITCTYEFNGAWEAPALAVENELAPSENGLDGMAVVITGLDGQNTITACHTTHPAGEQDAFSLNLNEYNGEQFIYAKFAKVTDSGVEGDNIYTIQMHNADAQNYALWGQAGYLNFQTPGQNIVFVLGLNNQYGQDAQNCGLWRVTEVEDGYIIQNVGNGGYYDPNNAAPSAEPVVVKFWQNAVADADSTIVTGINNIATSTTANGKYFQNGKVVIVKNDVKYNVNGAVIK